MEISHKELTTEQYLSYHNIGVYFQDAVSQMLECKSENIKVDAKKFLHDYFTSIKEGTQTLFREYSFIYSTYQNRRSFISNIWSIFGDMCTQGDLLSVTDYHSLLCLLCSDFDIKILQKTVKIILMDDATDCVMSFTDFIYAFQLQFYYDEFCTKCFDIFTEIQQKSVSSSNISTDDSPPSNPDSISANYYLHSIRKNIYSGSSKTAAPPECIIVEILSKVSNVTFYGFMISLNKNEKLCESVGVLPSRPNSSLFHR